MNKSKLLKVAVEEPTPPTDQGGGLADIEMMHVQQHQSNARLSKLRSSFAKETKITSNARSNRHNRKTDDGEINKKQLSAHQNTTSCCVQLRDQLQVRAKHLVRNSCCVLVASSCVLILSAIFFGLTRNGIIPQAFPDFKVEKLKHPLFQTAYLDKQKDAFYGDYQTTKLQNQELESFMQFADYTNIEKKTGRKIMVNGTVTDEKVPSYDVASDQTGPGFWIPMQCDTNVTYKYKSPLIALVKRGTQLEKDLFTQIQAIFANMASVSNFIEAMENFFDKVTLGPKKDEQIDEDVSEAEEPPEPDEKEEKNSNRFRPPKELLKTGGGAAENPHPVILENLGQFIFRGFDSEADLFSYVEQDGYGWEPEKPAICFAFQIHENKAKNKYELELYFRDQWPRMYNTIDRLDSNPAPVSSAANILAYTRQAYNGLNHMQIFAANSILQRRLGPEAEIIMMTVPFKIKVFMADSFLLLVVAFCSFFQFMALLPLTFYFAIALAREKEVGFTQRLFESGLSRITHFFSWLLYYTVLNVLFSLCYTLALKNSIYVKDEFRLIFLLTFLAVESIFSFVWALRTLSNSTRTAIVVTAFAVFASFYLSFASDQLNGILDHDLKRRFALSPLTAIKNTVDTYAFFHTMEFPMTFDNWDTKRFNWSLNAGVNAFIYNFVFYLLVGIVLELLFNAQEYFGNSCLKRKVSFENTNKGIIVITGLQERRAIFAESNEAVYNFVIQKSEICCLIGTDIAQKTSLMEMIAGLKDSKGTIVVKDSDFFARSKKPKLNEFLVYRSQDVVLDEDLTASDHLNLFAHLRGNQKFIYMQYLMERLLPVQKRVKEYSESQSSTLQTLIALCSENSLICLLDEPTRGLGSVARGELIKAMQRFKKDRYLIIQSSDVELVNILADSAAKVLSTGIEMVVSSQKHDDEVSSYRLIVEVQDGKKPNDALVRYLSQEVSDLTLEYHTDQLTYYILPNITRHLLLQKTQFVENNKQMLGLIDFEFVTLSAIEVASRDLTTTVSPNDGYENSFDDVEYQSATKPSARNSIDNLRTLAEVAASRNLSNKTLQKMQTAKVHAAPAFVEEKSPFQLEDENGAAYDEDQEDCDVESDGNRYMPASADEHSQKYEIASEAIEQPHSPIETEHLPPNLVTHDIEEMQKFQDMDSEPLKKPAYHRDFYYDFKKYKTKRKFGPLQCPAICRKHIKQHWRNKSRCLAMFILPSLYVYFSWHSIRYFRHTASESLSLTPEILPHKQPILVNEKTQVGGKDTKRWIQKLPMSDEAFQPTYIDTSDHKDFFGFENALFDFCVNEATQQPWVQGAYQFYEMDEDRHKYKILSYSNITAPFSTSLFPQFIIESVMKTALDDDEFEFKTKVTALPIPKEIRDKGNFMNFHDHTKTIDLISRSNVIGVYSRISYETVGCIAAAWFMLNAVTLIQLMRERTSEQKRFLESHGQSQFSYWFARYVHDLIFYLPVSIVAIKIMQLYEPQMEAAPRSIMLQPFAMLPFLYVLSTWFRNELRAVLSILGYQLFVQWILPYLTVYVRLAAKIEIVGDQLFRFMKALPMLGSISSMIFNTEVLKVLGEFREVNDKGAGSPIETDEMHETNARLDQKWMLYHIIGFWFILLVLIEWRLLSFCCQEMDKITEEDNEVFFKDDEDYYNYSGAGESSEVAQILGEGTDLQLRFHIKQKPRKQLAYILFNYRLNKSRRGCCFCFKRKECLINELSAQVQAGSKYAIIADGVQGKTSILNSLTNHSSTYTAAGLIKKQVGRHTPVYTTQSYEVLFTDLTLAENIDHFVSLGSIHPRLANQMIVAFGLYTRKDKQIQALNASEKHLTMLILALAGSNRTVILDEPFTGLTHDQTIKLVKIVRQKYDCTLIVTAKTKAQLDMLQPQSLLNICPPNQPEEGQQNEKLNYLLSVRLKPQQTQIEDLVNPLQILTSPITEPNGSQQEPEMGMNGEELQKFIAQNFVVFEKLRGKKRSLVAQVVQKLFSRARIAPEISLEIGEMVHEDLEMQSSSQEIAIKCELIISLYKLIDALCNHFGEVNLECRQDNYAVLRIFPSENHMKKNNDSFTDQRSSFSSILEFVNQSKVMRDCTTSCQFLSARNAIRPSGKTGSYQVKTFVYSIQSSGMELLKSSDHKTVDLPPLVFNQSENVSSQDRREQVERWSVGSIRPEHARRYTGPYGKVSKSQSAREQEQMTHQHDQQQ